MTDSLIYHIDRLPHVLVYMIYKRIKPHDKKKKTLEEAKQEIKKFYGTFVKVPKDMEHFVEEK